MLLEAARALFFPGDPPISSPRATLTSDAAPSLHTLNGPGFDTANYFPGTMTLFPTLPLELRERIWGLSLPDQRLLQVTVTAASASQSNGFTTPLAPYQSRNKLGNIISGTNYHLELLSTDTISPLLYVNHEANAIVGRVYRVHVPVTSRIPSSDARCLRFCPEQDTILINAEWKHCKAYFADFVHDALAYDQKGKGILHLAIMADGKTWVTAPHFPVGLHGLHRCAQAALFFTLGGLESVSLVHLRRVECREMSSRLRCHFRMNETPQTGMVRINRAYPLWSSNASYSMLPVDPRPVSRYLDSVDCEYDPRRLIVAWREFESAYNVEPTSPDRIRVIIATTDPQYDLEIATINQARWFRQKEEALWRNGWDKWRWLCGYYPEVSSPDTDEDREFSETQNAVGFWSVPLEAFGPLPDDPHDYTWEKSPVCDFTAFESQIQLGLFTLP
ncbi:hypothetical protein BU23DRAFT_602237 [Bimuria novae-zelandiae CBS 107.79]|uniref:2EXR domain-containing protein n=1 Tax=Bimuria novae-zelandiae CBS 107.79 TaxID=1447943 RepID=A0A6A5UUF5_9PLEO|nr:hypothetical protein BU23DRAFT_602237 [Bimuria novae-zelandiae CBS 107.79]